ncbi:hypothetical protein RJP21_22895 [Paenibacillus sp. VCA1]|uniref:hypothetical protein n=1 Tax=Paenibacillus sp. VCA1 TaxID=3039148 RepID=UPI002870DCD8|nr:hypothetical protein [Paenibacillus sp. VCA1]MDR9856455.1 hypothetical protein [Paenibacillus sp. VCA1]
MNKEITYTADNNIFADRFCRRIQYVKMIYRSLKPTGLFGIACFRPDFGDQGAPVREMSDWDVYEESTMNTIINYKLNTVEEEHSSEINKWLANARETGEEGQYFTYSYSDNTKENMYLYVYRKGYRNYEVSFIYDPSDSNYPGKIHVTGINKDKENDDFVQIQSINDLSIQIILSDESLKNKLK